MQKIPVSYLTYEKNKNIQDTISNAEATFYQ